jgi:hypothetical protein
MESSSTLLDPLVPPLRTVSPYTVDVEELEDASQSPAMVQRV